MRSSARLLPLLLAGCGASGEGPRPSATTPIPAPAAPRGSSADEADLRYSAVGYASWYGEELAGRPTASGAPFNPGAITAAHRTLPLGSHAEVTALDSGRTIVVLINDRGPHRDDRLIDLSRGAAALLGTNAPLIPVRVRRAYPAPADVAALATGRPASPRLDTPPAVLAALRRDLPASSSPAPAPAVRQAPVAAAGSRYLVQVAAFASEQRAEALARALDGRVESARGLHRVRLGPFADVRSAERARDDAARRGYGDATIVVHP